MGWKTGSNLPENPQRDQTIERRRPRQDDSLRLPDTRRRKRRNAVTMSMMEDLLQSKNFEDLINIYSTRTNSISAGEWSVVLHLKEFITGVACGLSAAIETCAIIMVGRCSTMSY